MTTTPRAQPTIEAGRLWAGGAATAVVAGLVGLVGILIGQDVLNLDMAQPSTLPAGSSFAVRYAITAAVLALCATGVAHLLALTTPRPGAFLSWIIGLVTLVGVVLPFTIDGTVAGQVATAVVSLVTGLSVLSLLSSVLVRTVHPGAPVRP
jgi:hypothetical protein